jgi:copper homeostasis protein
VVKLEVCVDSATGLAAAVSGGADRIELCAALELGGLTPSPGLISMAAGCGVPVMVMIRPRPGDFVFGPADLDTALADISAARSAGLAGVVLGAGLADGTLDIGALAQMATAARGMDLTLHRVFDLVPDMTAALDGAIALGFNRVLTSGGAARASDAVDRLAALFAQADGRIGILPGAGITSANVGLLLDRLPVTEIHSSCSVPVSQNARHVQASFCRAERRVTTADMVREMKKALRR